MRHLAAFFVLGAALFYLKGALLSRLDDAPPRLTVSVAPNAPPAAVERAIDEAVLIAEALERGGAHVDPLVRERLSGALSDSDARLPREREGELVDRALQLGVARVDPVVRQRLVFQAQQLLRARLPLATPGDAELSAYLSAHRARYVEPETVSLTQVFVSRARRGKDFERAVSELSARFESAEIRLEDAPQVSDPSLFPLELEHVSERELDARFGPDFGASVLASPAGRFAAPILSSYGAHFVYVRERRAARSKDLSALRERVLADYLHDQSERALARATKALRSRYTIVVERSAS